jgi:putative phage-type endonuclease
MSLSSTESVSDVKQGSPEWFALRIGKVTASRVADVMARTKTGWGASRANYMAEIIAERLTGTTAASFSNAAMQWGTEKEPEARAAYSFYADTEVVEVGFVTHPTIAMSGASPDGHIGDDGSTEFKCPQTATHLETLLGEPIAAKYITQCQWQMACNGRKWCDWASFDPRLPENMRLFVKRINRDDAMIADLEKNVRDFLAEVDFKIAALTKLYGKS